MNKTLTTIKRSLLLLAILFLASCSKILTNEEFDLMQGDPAQEYSATFLGGAKVGFDRIDHIVQGNKITTKRAKLWMHRDNEQDLDFSSCIETADGKILEFQNEKIKGQLNDSGSFDIIDLKTGKTLRQMQWPDDALMYEGYKKLQQNKGLAEGTTYEATLFSIYSLDTFTHKVIVGKKKEVKLIDTKETLTELFITETHSSKTINGTQYIDDEFNIKKTVIPIGPEITKVLCDREYAISENKNSSDILTIKSPESLVLARRAHQIKYVIKPKIENLEIVSTDNQTVTKGENGTLIITSQPAKMIAGVTFPYAGNHPAAIKALEPTDLLQCDEEIVVTLAKKAVGNTTDAAKAAKKIEAFVQSHLSKGDLKDVDGFPSALETAKAKRGDCKGHASLTAAMCRVVGIPSRMVYGYLYVSYHNGHWQAFGAHVWTEAYIGDKWIGLDATRNTVWGLFKSYDPTYIAIDTFSTKDFKANIGTFEIEKIKVTRKK